MGPNLFLPLKSCNYSHIKSHSARAIPQEGEIPSSGVLQDRGAPAGRVTEQKPPDVPGAAQQVQLAGGGMGTQHRCLCIPQPSLPALQE